jgi:5-methylcytosine-specific restriction endonuclease McrA
MREKKRLSRSQRKRILRRKLWIFYEGKCHYCGRDTILPEKQELVNGSLLPNSATIEHIHARQKYADERDLRLACYECNNRRGDSNYSAFKLFKKYVKQIKPLKVPISYYVKGSK